MWMVFPLEQEIPMSREKGYHGHVGVGRGMASSASVGGLAGANRNRRNSGPFRQTCQWARGWWWDSRSPLSLFSQWNRKRAHGGEQHEQGKSEERAAGTKVF